MSSASRYLPARSAVTKSTTTRLARRPRTHLINNRFAYWQIDNGEWTGQWSLSLACRMTASCPTVLNVGVLCRLSSLYNVTSWRLKERNRHHESGFLFCRTTPRQFYPSIRLTSVCHSRGLRRNGYMFYQTFPTSGSIFLLVFGRQIFMANFDAVSLAGDIKCRWSTNITAQIWTRLTRKYGQKWSS